LIINHLNGIRSGVFCAIQSNIQTGSWPLEEPFSVVNSFIGIYLEHELLPNGPGCTCTLPHAPGSVMNAAFITTYPYTCNQVWCNPHIPAIGCVIGCTRFSTKFIIYFKFFILSP